jgi:Uri superfamily endonuclease
MKGSYMLLLSLATPCLQLSIGKLGVYDMAAGCYLYVGSAYGMGGLPARLAYHRRVPKVRCHWHIDYLREVAHLEATWSVACAQRLEHIWGAALLAAPGVTVPIAGFGASDSPLPAHLFCLPRRPSLRFLAAVLLPDMLTRTGHEPVVLEIAHEAG